MYKITCPSFIIKLGGFLFFLLLLLQNDFLLHICTGINDDHITILMYVLHDLACDVCILFCSIFPILCTRN